MGFLLSSTASPAQYTQPSNSTESRVSNESWMEPFEENFGDLTDGLIWHFICFCLAQINSHSFMLLKAWSFANVAHVSHAFWKSVLHEWFGSQVVCASFENDHSFLTKSSRSAKIGKGIDELLFTACEGCSSISCPKNVLQFFESIYLRLIFALLFLVSLKLSARVNRVPSISTTSEERY